MGKQFNVDISNFKFHISNSDRDSDSDSESSPDSDSDSDSDWASELGPECVQLQIQISNWDWYFKFSFKFNLIRKRLRERLPTAMKGDDYNWCAIPGLMFNGLLGQSWSVLTVFDIWQLSHMPRRHSKHQLVCHSRSHVQWFAWAKLECSDSLRHLTVVTYATKT